MARRSRRTRKRSRAPRLSPAQMVQPSEEIPHPDQKPVPRVAAEDGPVLGEEYRYVVADLKRIAAIAAVMLAVMLGLALLLV